MLDVDERPANLKKSVGRVRFVRKTCSLPFFLFYENKSSSGVAKLSCVFEMVHGNKEPGNSALDIVAHDAPDTTSRGAQDSVTYRQMDCKEHAAKGGAWSTGLL